MWYFNAQFHSIWTGSHSFHGFLNTFLVFLIFSYVLNETLRERERERERERVRNLNRDGERGVEDMEFPGVLKKYHVEILGVNWKRSEIFRGDQEIMLHFHESWFLTLDFPRGVTQFYRISKAKGSFVLSRISEGKVTNLRDPGIFFKKSMTLILPVWIFLEQSNNH